jgi:large subunit ribosomal protein L25
MRTIAIQAESRERTGKGGARSARREGRLPGVLYGQGKSIHLTVNRREFGRAIQAAAGENIIFDVNLAGESSPLKSIARDVQRHPVSRELVHVDFQHIDMSKPINVSIVVHLLGEPEGVKNFGGILEHPTRELEVSCLPANIPSHIDVDVSAMMIGDSVHVSDLPSSGFEFLDEPERVVVHVAAPTVEKVVAEGEEGAEAAEGEEGAAEGEGEGESKEDGEGS